MHIYRAQFKDKITKVDFFVRSVRKSIRARDEELNERSTLFIFYFFSLLSGNPPQPQFKMEGQILLGHLWRFVCTGSREEPPSA